MGKDIEGIVVKPKNFNSFKVTTPDFKSAMSDKMALRKQNAQNSA
jgi:hypothetical protein